MMVIAALNETIVAPSTNVPSATAAKLAMEIAVKNPKTPRVIVIIITPTNGFNSFKRRIIILNPD